MKFIRFGQHYIENNKSGILAFINPHGFLDNPTFRGVRWSLLKTYDKIYTIDLHGSATEKESIPDGEIDENIFDIKEGVSINVFIKTDEKGKSDLAKVFHYDLFGKRDFKFNFLYSNSIKSIKFVEVQKIAPYYFFSKRIFSFNNSYETGFQITDLFIANSVGIVTAREDITIAFNEHYIKDVISDLEKLPEKEIKYKYNLPNDTRDWTIQYAKKDITHNKGVITKIACRPFDIRYTYYTGTTKGFYSYPRNDIMRNFIEKDNIGIVVSKQAFHGFKHVFVTKTICNLNLTGTAGKFGAGYTFPLFLYPDKSSGQKITDSKTEREPNLNMKIVNVIAEKLNLAFLPDISIDCVLPDEVDGAFTPIDLLDYIYAVLHSPSYREKYKEFLKIDFPRVPYPENKEIFWELVKLGGELRQIHLMESPKVEQYITRYPIAGDNVVGKQAFKAGKVYINETQYFDNVPETAYEFYIGGYQPAQKWLKDRKGRTLSYEDILHYQKIIVALTETDRIMNEIDQIIDLPPKNRTN